VLSLGCGKKEAPVEKAGRDAFTRDAVHKLLDMPRLGPSGNTPYIRGKYVFIDGDTREWSPTTKTQPEADVAQRPSDASTIFLETRTRRDVAQYTGGIKGVGTVLKIQVIDVAEQNIVGEKTFEARDLPRSQLRGADDKSPILATGNNEDVSAWIRSLPRR